MTVQALLQPFLVQVMTDKARAATQDEQSVDGADFNVFHSFLPVKQVPYQVNF